MDDTRTAGGDAGCVLLSALRAALHGLDQGVDDGVRIDRIRLLEELKGAVAAAQARESAAFAESQRAVQVAAGVPVARAGRGVAGQVGLARRVSPFEAARYVGWCRILTSELPATFAALRAGAVSEWPAMIVARESAWLSREHRGQVDAEIAGELPRWGPRRVEAEVNKRAYRLDPHGYLDRLRGVESQRRVSLRPAPDTMARLSALLPVAQGVAAYAALTREADRARSAGDPRGRGQVMADTLVERLTGQTSAAGVAVEINLVMTDHTLLGSSDEPAHLSGYGPLPAPTARHLALHASAEAPRWLRRLFTHPDSGQLMGMESRRRCFTPTQRHYLTLRDQHCRTPWCEAPIRHADHIRPAEHGGPTHINNGQGDCEACNYARQAPGWTLTTPTGNAGDEVLITTPTGHHYASHPPDPPGTRQRGATDTGQATDRRSTAGPPAAGARRPDVLQPDAPRPNVPSQRPNAA